MGLEPTRRCHRGILSPLRLPVLPRPLWPRDQILSAISGRVELPRRRLARLILKGVRGARQSLNANTSLCFTQPQCCRFIRWHDRFARPSPAAAARCRIGGVACARHGPFRLRRDGRRHGQRVRRSCQISPVSTNTGHHSLMMFRRDLLRASASFVLDYIGFRDDGIVPVICPTCQPAVDFRPRRLLCMGLFSIFWPEPLRSRPMDRNGAPEGRQPLARAVGLESTRRFHRGILSRLSGGDYGDSALNYGASPAATTESSASNEIWCGRWDSNPHDVAIEGF